MKSAYRMFVLAIISSSVVNASVKDARQLDIEDCEYLGVFYGSSGWGNLAANMGIQNSKEEAKENAEKANATHILWKKENRGYTTSVEGEGYNCNNRVAVKKKTEEERILNITAKTTNNSGVRLETIAVLNLETSGVDTNTSKIITDLLINNLQVIGKYRVLERNKISEILKEQSFQNSGACSQSDCAIEMGRLLSLGKIIVGSIGRLGESYVISLRTINVENGEVIKISSKQIIGGIEKSPQVIMEMAEDLSK